MMLLGTEGRKRLELRSLSNDELFRRYDPEIVLRLAAPRNLHDTRKMLQRFKNYLGDFPPSAGLAKAFLAQYSGRAPRTIYRYAMMVKPFMRWYGDPIDDIRIKIPRSLPQYTQDQTVDKLNAAIDSKKRGRKYIERDKLIVLMGEKTGLRRGEMARLRVRDVFDESLIVRKGKNNKDRVMPLAPSLKEALHKFIAGRTPEELVFNLGAPSLGMIIKMYAKKAGLTDFHTHTLRDKFASDLLAAGVDIETVRILMGHEKLNTTQAYLALNPEATKEAITKLDKKKPTPKKHEAGTDLEKVNESLNHIKKRLDNAGTEDAASGKDILKETAHTQKMRELAKALGDKISLPSLWDENLWRDLPLEFQPGSYSLSVGVVEIDKNKRVKVHYQDPVQPSRHLRPEVCLTGGGQWPDAELGA